MYFSKAAHQVTIVLRGDSLKSTRSSYPLDRVRFAKNIQVLAHTEVLALDGDQCQRGISLTNRKTGDQITFQTRWLFICIGGAPHTPGPRKRASFATKPDIWSPARVC